VKYRVCGYRYRHKNSEHWALCIQLPRWVRRLQPSNKFWIIERLYHRLKRDET